MTFEGFPFNIGWELTLACNLQCHHCASAAGKERARELTTEEALRLCDQFPPLLVQEVDLTGGEPLLRKDWSVIASRLRDLGIAVNILTNGAVVQSDTFAAMKDAAVANLGVSLDGLKETHDSIRGRRGSYDSVVRCIDAAARHGIRQIVITTVNERNRDELPAMLDLLLSLGVAHWRLQPIIPLGRVLGHAELEIGDRGVLALGDFIANSVADAKRKGLRIICSDGLEYIPGTEEPDRPWRGCPAGLVTCGITSDGWVKGCLSLPDGLVEGDLRQTDLWDIWFNPSSFAYTRQSAPETLGANCSSCAKAAQCKGGCSANSYAVTGQFHNDPYCHYRLSSQRNCSECRGIPRQPGAFEA